MCASADAALQRALPRHADALWLEELQEAIAAWLASADGLPTSQVTGQGAIRAVEVLLAELHEDRWAALVPSATYGMRVVLQALGVGPGADVLIPCLDWPSTQAAVYSLGATPIPVDVDPQTLTIAPAAAAARRTAATKAAVGCHLHGVPADVPHLREALPGVAIVEDCAQALGSTLRGHTVGTLGDAAVFSFGPGKRLEAGEAGVIVVPTVERYRDVLRLSGHPLRQLLGGVESLASGFSMRVHPVAAIQLWHKLSRWQAEADRQATDRGTREVGRWAGGSVLGGGGRRVAGSVIPVLLRTGDADRPPGWQWGRSGAQALPGSSATAVSMLERVRLVEQASVVGGGGR